MKMKLRKNELLGGVSKRALISGMDLTREAHKRHLSAVMNKLADMVYLRVKRYAAG